MLKHKDWPGLEKIAVMRKAEASGARRLSIRELISSAFVRRPGADLSPAEIAAVERLVARQPVRLKELN